MMSKIGSFFKKLLDYWWLILMLAAGVLVAFYKDFLVNLANRSLVKTKDEAEKLERERQELLSKADAGIKLADEARERIEVRKEEDVDVDWHKKRND